ncbi:DUF4880 domain-containing protein [Pseudomonas sp. RP23018S]|uniref:DUF4880 domain-containing protein n=1 Tax=Pseudomonas sp. RP23018S TaxID=3096037 RepID=UPI002ACAE0DD|nr:DUF4880 domain-containing protein [Pseudomonas sp. RP23018S]MDZ5602437.1 DUF4880 domain-containing protein [Pseudomonas sp. RP23018S]
MSRLTLPLAQRPQAAAESAHNVLLQRLKRLPRRTLQVFLLNRLDQLDFNHIAVRLGLTASGVEKLMNQALLNSLPPGSRCRGDACHWYIRLQSPAATACERIDFRRWLDASPLHLQAFHDTELHWRSLLAPARMLGERSSYRHGRAALSLGGCSLAVGLAAATLLAFGLWA